jgi:DNA-binding NtrC family response regulator
MAPLLLVDGDRNFGRALAVALRLDGQQVIMAESVETALAELSSERFQIAVVDSLLPGADMLLQRLAACGIRVVATGTYPELLLRTASRHPGVSTIEKPFRASDLTAHLASPPPAL